MARLTKAQQQERDEAITRLREWLKPGDTVYCILRHVSRSGMLRVIDLAATVNGETVNIGRTAAVAMADPYDYDRRGIRIPGAGMDMGFALVYNLGRTLWPSGYGCTGAGCGSNDHSNGDRDYTPHARAQSEQAWAQYPPGTVAIASTTVETMPGHWHNDGGYALTARWL